MTTLAEATLETARLVDEITDGTATGGATTRLNDTSLLLPDGYFDDGTIWFLSGSLAGKSAVVTSYTQTVVNFTTQTAAVVAGVMYAVLRPRYTRSLLIASVNQALTHMGMTTQIDDTLDSVADQEEYDLPDGVNNVVRVDVASETSAPFKYVTNYWWREVGRKLIFDRNKAPDEDGTDNIRLYYNAPHAWLSLDTDEIDPAIHPMRLAWTAAMYATLSRIRLAGADEPGLAEQYKLANYNESLFAVRYPVNRMGRTPHLNPF